MDPYLNKILSMLLPGSVAWYNPQAKRAKTLQTVLSVVGAAIAMFALISHYLFGSLAGLFIMVLVMVAILVAGSLYLAPQTYIYVKENGVLYHVTPTSQNQGSAATGAAVGGLIGAAIGSAIDEANDKNAGQVVRSGVLSMAAQRMLVAAQIIQVSQITETEKHFKVACTTRVRKPNGTNGKQKTQTLTIGKQYAGIDSLIAELAALRNVPAYA